MKDIPVFTTDYGVASLVLKEIPYREEAYVHIRDFQPGMFLKFLEETVSFCRAAGAEKIYACGTEELEQFPEQCMIYKMVHNVLECLVPDAALFPVTEETAGKWREIYNRKMKNIDHAATLSQFDEKKIYEKSGAYFVHRNGTLQGIGWMDGHKILALASVVPGGGKTTLHNLLCAYPGENYELEVASTNCRAISLYESMGFVTTSIVNQWYRIFENKSVKEKHLTNAK